MALAKFCISDTQKEYFLKNHTYFIQLISREEIRGHFGTVDLFQI